jgi:hypothetical protein
MFWLWKAELLTDLQSQSACILSQRVDFEASNSVSLVREAKLRMGRLLRVVVKASKMRERVKQELACEMLSFYFSNILCIWEFILFLELIHCLLCCSFRSLTLCRRES